MGATDEIEIVPVQEFGHHIGTERERDAAIVLAPALHILVRIRPQQITEQARVGHVRWAHDASNLFHRVQVGRQT